MADLFGRLATLLAIIQLSCGQDIFNVDRRQDIFHTEPPRYLRKTKTFITNVNEITDLRCEKLFGHFTYLAQEVRNLHLNEDPKEKRSVCCDFLENCYLSAANKNCVDRYESSDELFLRNMCDKDYYFDGDTGECVQVILEEKEDKQVENDINFFEVTLFVSLGLLCIILVMILGSKLMKLMYDQPMVSGLDTNDSFTIEGIKGIRYHQSTPRPV